MWSPFQFCIDANGKIHFGSAAAQEFIAVDPTESCDIKMIITVEFRWRIQ